MIPPLLGRRIHISGSISQDVAIATPEAVAAAREFVAALVAALVRDGASFVVPIDCDPERASDGLPRCFDWLVLETLDANLRARPKEAVRDGGPLIIAVQHYKNESQIPDKYRKLWEDLKDTDGLMLIDNAGRWNMASKRMDIQAPHGDILITLGGDEGVLYLADLYHDAGKPVIPLNLPLVADGKGSLRLFERALASSETHRFFRTADGSASHDLINRLHFSQTTPVAKKVALVQQTLHALRKPQVFAVRLLNPDHDDFKDVENYFSGIIQPVIEELGYQFKTVDGKLSERSIVNQEIFENLYYSSIVVVDITGVRPNCFIELGYALGRGKPTMVCARKGTLLPFDINPVPANFWDATELLETQKEQFRSYWKANINRRPIVETTSLVP